MKKLTLMLLSLLIAGLQLVQAQGVTITGRTIDGSTGIPLPGVTVQVQGTTVGAISQADGTYRIANVPAGSNALIFSFIGFQTQEVAIAGRTVIDVTLQEEVTALEEIVVTGYSVERKKDIIGSVSVVNTDEMLTTPSGNLTAQLAGRVAGVSVSADGSLGGSSKVRVRGFGSFASSEPLYVIDGVPSESVDNINPNDIESMQFLKDAASAAVYGSRAASGVVIITTRQGREGPVQVNLDAYYGINYVSERDFPELLDGQEWGEYIWQSMSNDGLTPTHQQYGSGPTPVIPEYLLAVNYSGLDIGGAALEEMRISDPEQFAWAVDPANYDYANHPIVKSAATDWFDEVYNPAPITNVQLTAAGGSDRGNYALSLNYFDQEQTSDEYSYYTRYTVRANSTFNIQRIIRLGENLQIMYNEGRNVGFPASAWTMPAILPVWDIAGNPASSRCPDISKTNRGGKGNNPFSYAWHDRFDKYYNYGIFGNVFAELTLFNDLVLRSSFGLDFNYGQNRNLSQTTWEHAESNGQPNQLVWTSRDNVAWTWTNQATYTKTLGNHLIKLLVGTEAINQVSSSNQTDVQGFVINDNLSFLVPSAGTGTKNLSGSFTPYKLLSYFGRLDYTYADKYIFNATIRRDGSSKFGPNSRWGNFPSVAVGWRVTGEEFMKGITWLTDLKLRASYGIVGNQSGLAYNNQFTTFVQSVSETYPIGGASQLGNSYTKSRKGNPDARWEKSTTQNYGLDATFFAGSTSLAVDFYIKETDDLLVQNQAPYTEASVTQPYINVGDIKNIGLDVNLTQRGRIAGQVDYEVSANFSTYKNEVLKIMDDPAVALYGGSAEGGNACITIVGEEISSFYGYKIGGFLDDEAELNAYIASIPGGTYMTPRLGGWWLVDQNDDGIINAADRTILGSPHPDFQVGFNLALAWKGLDFSAFLFWNQGGQVYNDARYNVDFNTYAFNRSKRMLYESWTPETKETAKLPRLSWNDVRSAQYPTDYLLEDATYLRVRTMQLGYTLPRNLISKIRLNTLRVYIQGQNLITVTNKEFSALDPGVSLTGSDLGMGVLLNFNPTPKQIIFGINIGF
ncbi:MAG: TonB-dependent receptor [Bacteroidales bacterium]|nr:TonB-dependent receptor [Bacteroidales bacterium]